MKKVFIATVACIALAISVSAQNSPILFGSTYIPQKNNINPAFYPSDNTLYVSLAGFNPELHIPLSDNDIFYDDKANNSHYMNLWDMAEKLKKDNNLFFNTDIHLIGFGMRIHNLFVSFSATTNIDIHFGAPTGLVSLLANKFEGMAGKEYSVVESNIVQATAYNTFAFGGGYSIGDLTVGARLKLHNGICDFRSDDTRFDLSFDENGKLTTAIIAYDFTATGSQIFRQKTFGDVAKSIFSGKNWGYTLDIGAKYNWNMFEFSASILDLGKGIHWKNDIIKLTPHDRTYVSFEETDLGHVVVDNWDSIGKSIDAILDTLQTSDSAAGQPYWTSIPTKINFGAMAKIGSMFRAGVLFHGEFDKSISCFDKSGNPTEKTLFRNSTSLVFAANLYNWLEVMATFAVVKDGNKTDWFNPGLGLNFSFGKFFQIYALANYVSSLRRSDIKSTNFQIGLNLMFGSGPAKVINND